jgi:hypothetical protein
VIRKRGDERHFSNQMVKNRCDENVLAATWNRKEVKEKSHGLTVLAYVSEVQRLSRESCWVVGLERTI